MVSDKIIHRLFIEIINLKEKVRKRRRISWKHFNDLLRLSLEKNTRGKANDNEEERDTRKDQQHS